MNLDQYKVLLLLLVSVILVSKEILILNDETLITIAFSCTVYFFYKSSQSSVPQFLNERASTLEKKLKQNIVMQLNSLDNIIIFFRKSCVEITNLRDIFKLKYIAKLLNDIIKSDYRNEKLNWNFFFYNLFGDIVKSKLENSKKKAVNIARVSFKRIKLSRLSLDPKLVLR